MKRIVVGGAWSNCGKTSLVEMLLQAFPGWGAIKVTPSRAEEICPLGHCCGACLPPSGPFEVLTDPGVLAEPGKDTARFMKAGAAKVAWVRGPVEALPEALALAMAQMTDVPGVIVESTTAMALLEGLNLLVIREDTSDLKDSARSSAGRVDMLVLNAPAPPAPASAPPAFAALLGARQTCRTCAILPPEHPANAAFISACRAALDSWTRQRL